MNISQIRKVMADEGIVFSFTGKISQSMISFMVEAVKVELENMGEDSKMTRNMFLIAIEQLQNIMSYAKDKHKDGKKYTSQGVMLVGFDKEKKKYYVNCSNEIEEKDK